MFSRLLPVLLGLSSLFSLPMLGQGSPSWTYLTEYAKENRSAAGDRAAFARLTQPFAPLDIQVAGLSVDQARQMKSFFFGIAASTCGITLTQATVMTEAFHCARCTQSRMDDLRASLPEIQMLVERFEKTSLKLTLVAQWGTPGEYRVNSIFHVKNLTREYKAALDVFPGAAGRSFPDPATALRTAGLTEQELKQLVLQMSALHIVALEKTPAGTRALHGGVTSSEAGLLFLSGKAAGPKTRDTQNGLGNLVKMADGIYYFEN